MQGRGIGYTILFTFGITFLITMLLSATHEFTAPLARLHELERRQGAILSALAIETASREEVFAQYAALDVVEQNGHRLYYADSADGTGAFAKEFAGPGVWGEISGVLSLSSDGSRIVGIEILDQNETPGLGGRVTEDAFLDQFRGELVAAEGLEFVYRAPGDMNKENSSVDGISGATGTSRAMDSIVNREIAEFRQLLPEANTKVADTQ